VAAITSYPTPTSVKELKTFYRMISYFRMFIPNCSRIAFPLQKLLKNYAKFEWKPEQERAIQHLKAKTTSQPIRQYPDFSKECILTMPVTQPWEQCCSKGRWGKICQLLMLVGV
jgi:hypothetical protein